MRESVKKMFGLDPLDFMWLAPGLALALWAQWRLWQACGQGKVLAPTRRITGAQAAAEVIQFAGITGVAIEPGKDILTDHYDARRRVLRLRPDVYYGQSLTALGLAAHEAGHALQEATGYPLLGLRNGLVPLASFGSYTSWLLILTGGTLVVVQSLWGEPILLLGMGAFSVTVLFQLMNLPVEFDASKRAERLLGHAGMITVVEDPVVQRVLHAAALTYVAAPLTVLWPRLYCFIRALLLAKERSQ
jgi:Zn-dependent membrane protease YugP